MTSSKLSWTRLLLCCPLFVNCGAAHEEPVARRTASLTIDGGERSFMVRAAVALLGRPPLDALEISDFTAAMGTDDNEALRRGALLDCMMGADDPPVCAAAREDFTRLVIVPH